MPGLLSATALRAMRAACLLLAACAAGAGWAQPAAEADFIYVVQPGDHPWNLAQRYLKDPTLSLRLQRLNRIADDRRIPPGTRLRVPQSWLRLQALSVRLLAVGEDTQLLSGGTRRAATAGERLQPATGLWTGPLGSAMLELDDGSRILVRRDTELRLVQAEQRVLGKATLVQIELLRGSLENQVRPLADGGGRFEIRAPAAVAAVRGTEFRVTADDTSLRTEVLQGLVQVANAAGRSDTGAGQGTVAGAGQAPRAPTPLAAAPDLSAVAHPLERLPIDWPLPAVPGATGYRTQLAPDAQFALVLSDERTQAPRLRARDVPDGRYVVRVRAIDADGLEGRTAEQTIEVRARPEPPLLIEPAAQAVTQAERPAFRWTQADPAYRYRLQIAREEAPATPVEDRTLAAGGSTAAEAALAPGLYRWRMAAIDGAKQGPWGDAQGFRRVLPGPGVGAPEQADGRLTLRWSAQPQTRGYRVQVAASTDFATLLVDTETAEPQHTVPGLVPGTHYVRVHSIGQDGYVGPWGAPQRFEVAPAPPSPWKGWPWLLLPLLLVP